MTEPVSVPARQRSPGHTLRPAAAAAAALCPRGCRLGTPSSDMSLSGHLCLLTVVGLILPSRGQILKEATSISPADLTSVNVNALTPPVPDTVHREPQSTPRMGLQTGGTTWEQMEGTQTPQPPEASELLAADRAMVTMTTGKSSLRATPSPEPTKGTTPSKRQSPGRDIRRDPPLGPTGSSEDDPFSYDEDTLRKRGLLVAAVLFITGIVILTSGKCRRLPQLCRNYNRIVSKAQPGREDPDGARAGADGPRPLCSPPCPP
ncbi:FXYD domain-containing ion transport regulator 5 isoform X1 [Canis lupus familiaris]|nr:FXYD domain-containing ion transport regulator 5 isoform X1 [Canis lupus dingo]XP_038309189.1 FXYD domain-containing ion transport regulator 5 isoform X1 [Canis lupus familiaris]XP_038385279.1 FXYD domain-containing ion transport regulator 5 isoform X1 [Canis lupus familiaris]